MSNGSRGLHKVRITIPDGRAILSRIEVDGQPLQGVTFIRVETGIPEKHDAQLTVRLFADIEIEGELPIVKEWRQARPLLQRLRWKLGL